MRKISGFQQLLFSLSICIIWSSIAQSATPGSFRAVDLNDKVLSGQYSKKIDNFLVIMDGSGSMDGSYHGSALAGSVDNSKFAVEKEILSRLNQTIPNLSINGGLRTFGFTMCQSWNRTLMRYGMAQFNKTDFNTGLNAQNCASGGTSLGLAIDEAVDDLNSSQGNIAVIVASDGNTSSAATLPYAQNLKAQYGDRLCIYSIWIGNDAAGKTLMQQISDIGGCGDTVSAEDIASAGNMAGYVERVFLAKSEQPTKAVVLDSDGDGVPDNIDKCPRTPKGVAVNEYGCWIGGKILFDFDKDTIKAEVHPLLDKLADALKQIPEVKVEITGHTDSIGSPSYNMDLSNRRANSVKNYLVGRGVNSDQLIATGMGLNHHLYPNDTPENRAKNRRVQLSVVPYH